MKDGNINPVEETKDLKRRSVFEYVYENEEMALGTKEPLANELNDILQRTTHAPPQYFVRIRGTQIPHSPRLTK